MGAENQVKRIQELTDKGVPYQTVLEEIGKLKLEGEKDQCLKKLSRDQKISIKALRKDLQRLASINPSKPEPDPLRNYSQDEIQAAKSLLIDHQLFDKIIDQSNASGHVGEIINKKVFSRKSGYS